MKQKRKVREYSEYAKSACISMVFPFGALAPDGRESGHQWHSRGQRFDPAYLHQKNTDFLLKSRCFSNFSTHFNSRFRLGQQLGQQGKSTSSLFAVESMVKMAYIQEKIKGKKIVSFKFKACVGRDADGKQVFKCTTWYPPDELTPRQGSERSPKGGSTVGG